MGESLYCEGLPGCGAIGSREPVLNRNALIKSTPPMSVVEAVARLEDILDEDTKLAIAGKPESALIDFHFELGQAIRNAWLWKGNPSLVSDCGVSHSDDASIVIIRALWLKLRTNSP